MSWVHNLCDTYDRCTNIVGLCREESQEKALLPIGHTLITPDMIIRLSENGVLIDCEKCNPSSKNDFYICAPCTDESEGRSGRNAVNYPHPLFDKIKYLTEEKYAENLCDWLLYLQDKPEFDIANKMLGAVYRYIQSGSIIDDLDNPKPDTLVCFRVELPFEISRDEDLWKMPELWNAWIDYYKSIMKNDRRSETCYILGEPLPLTEKHPKNINRVAANAKLISGNDTSNFTYRGRYATREEALAVSYEASQKAHQALRWLIADRGYRCGSQAIVAWAIDKNTALESFSASSRDTYNEYAKNHPIVTDHDQLIEAGTITDINYAQQLNTALFSAGNIEPLQTHRRRIAIMATDAATNGRLSVTYYRELAENEYWECLVRWHNTCKWDQPYFDDESERKHRYFIGAPSVDRIIEAVWGKKRSANDHSYEKLKKSARDRLLHCIMDGERIPYDMERSAVHRASNPLSLEKVDANSAIGHWMGWEQVLCAACALVHRHYSKETNNEEEYKMKFDEIRESREYLYGCLLAVADDIESQARFKHGSAKIDPRATNALRYMNVFSQRPFRTWEALWRQLIPYIEQLDGADWHLSQIGEIQSGFKDSNFVDDAALDGRYLMGFFERRKALRNSRKKKDDTKNSDDNRGGKDDESDEQN
jgi:CRISPR-associated protein Csd1